MSSAEWEMTILSCLSAYFQCDDGLSRPGFDWIVGFKNYNNVDIKIIVRTVSPTEQPQSQEDSIEIARQLLVEKLEQGWEPREGEMIDTRDYPIGAIVSKKKPWWKIW